MMRLILLLIIMPFYLPVKAQTPQPTILFVAEPGMLDFEFGGAYIIPQGANVEILALKKSVPLFAFYDETRPLEDNHIGMAVVDRVESNRTIISPFFKTGFMPRIGERILVDLPVRLPNPYYRSVTHRLASNAITMKDISGNVLLDLNAFDDDGLYIEYIILSLFRDDLIKTSLEMRGQMENIDIQGGRYDGHKLFETMTMLTLDDVATFVAFLNTYPASYMGYGHMFSEVFALWLLNGTPDVRTETERPSPASLGFLVVDDPEVGYPKIDRVSQAYYGQKGSLIVPGSHILYIGKKSMRQNKVADLDIHLRGEKYHLVLLSIQTPDLRTFDIEIPYMPLPDDPGWKSGEDAFEGEALGEIKP